MRSILCLTPSSLAFVLGGAHFWRAGQYPFSVGCMLFALLVWRREAWIRQVTLVLLPLLAARWVWAAAQFVQLRMFMEQPWMRLACILLGRVAVYRHGGPVAGRKDGGCMVCARQEEGAHADGGLFRDDLHPDAAAFRRTAGFPDGAFPARMGRRSISCLPGLGLVGGIAAWGQGCRAAYALIHLVPVLGGLFRTARPRPCRIRPVPHDREPSSPRAGHDPRGPAIPWRRAVHAHSVRRLRTAGRGCVVQPPVLFRGLG